MAEEIATGYFLVVSPLFLGLDFLSPMGVFLVKRAGTAPAHDEF
jgi:hypothetical protein